MDAAQRIFWDAITMYCVCVYEEGNNEREIEIEGKQSIKCIHPKLRL